MAPPSPPMRVLIMSLFHPELVRGGAQTIAFDLFKALERIEGVEPTFLGSIDSSYPALHKSGACITGFDNEPRQHLFLTQDYDGWWHKSGSARSIEAFAEFLLLLRPHVIHVHHFFLFGIDAISVARKVLPDVKIIMTFHEFMVICNANGHLVRTFDGTLCTKASSIRCHQCFPSRAPEEFLTRKLWFQAHLAKVDIFTCPSRFMIGIYDSWGIGTDRIRHVTNGIARSRATRKLPAATAARNSFGFFGQYVDAKGLDVILDAVEILRADGFDRFTVELNGSNLRYASPALRERFTRFVAAEGARPVSERIVFDKGAYDGADLGRRMQRVDWVVVPSVWWEIFCLVISEAWAFGRPVVCSDVGGPHERVRDGVDGLFFTMGDARDLALLIRRCCETAGLWDRLAAGIVEPATTAAMTRGFLACYDDMLGTATANEIAAAGPAAGEDGRLADPGRGREA